MFLYSFNWADTPSTKVKPQPTKKRRVNNPLEANEMFQLEDGRIVDYAEQNQQAIILVVPTSNASETVKQITTALKTTATVGIQAVESFPTTSTVGVGVEPPAEFCDFSGQYNYPVMGQIFYDPSGPEVRHISTGTEPNEYYYEEGAQEVRHMATITDPNEYYYEDSAPEVRHMATGTDANEYFYQEGAPEAPEVRHMSTGTDFTIPFMEYPRGSGQFVSFGYQQEEARSEYRNQPGSSTDYVSSEKRNSFDRNQQPVFSKATIEQVEANTFTGEPSQVDPPSTRTFGTTMDDFGVPAQDFDTFPRENETQTIDDLFWQEIDRSG